MSEQNIKFLYEITRKANVNADIHDQAAQAAKQLLEAVKEDENPVEDKKKK